MQGTALLALSATLKSLRPEPCDDGSNLCKPASKLQYSVLYLGLTLNTIGGSARFAITTLGANQFDKQDQNKFFNWYFINLYFTMFIGFTAIVYIEDNVSWGLGFGISAIANLIALVILLMGYGFYRHDVPRGRSPFLDLARVLVAAICKWKSNLSSRIEDYYGGQAHLPVIPEKRLRFFNRAALITEGDLGPNGSIAKPWRICTIQQVQDFKTLIGLLSVWSTTIFLSTPIAIQNNLTILQALTMDRHVGSHFKIPASSIVVAVQLSGAIFLILIDRIMLPDHVVEADCITHKFHALLDRHSLQQNCVIQSWGLDHKDAIYHTFTILKHSAQSSLPIFFKAASTFIFIKAVSGFSHLRLSGTTTSITTPLLATHSSSHCLSTLAQSPFKLMGSFAKLHRFLVSQMKYSAIMKKHLCSLTQLLHSTVIHPSRDW
ncbi:protein NRT1/ PTR FAMILY 2.6-like [Senna tora]|uniref:Protein NRT1/ PTR FAMILY 2.6-like n=1 Tax=Senna tora TaxID=362788 RepID=A0A834WI11_9FABA|nr:protein NRT1/ PTR FAMILY 2.6-like [Senna tora]